MSHLIVLMVVNTLNQVSLDSRGISVSNLKIQYLLVILLGLTPLAFGSFWGGIADKHRNLKLD